MKKILLILSALVFMGIGHAQTFYKYDNNYFYAKDSVCFGTPGDSISSIDFECQFKYVYFSYQASATGNDSLLIESYNPALNAWDVTGVRANISDSLFTTVVGLTSTKRLYLINMVRPIQVRITLINYRASTPTRKGYVSWVGKND